MSRDRDIFLFAMAQKPQMLIIIIIKLQIGRKLQKASAIFFANVAKILKSKSILLRDFVWMRPTWENIMSQRVDL